MIGRLRGEISYLDNDHLILDVNGVGYLVCCTIPILQRLTLGERTELWIEMEVKQEQIMLYGFSTLDDKRWFKILQSVQGVGAKLALSILSTLPPSDLVHAVVSADKNAFQKVSGVGQKLAIRLVTELRGKADSLAGSYTEPHIGFNKGLGNADQPTHPHLQLLHDAMSALVNFGFHKNDVQDALNNIIQTKGELELSELVKMGLTVLGSNK